VHRHLADHRHNDKALRYASIYLDAGRCVVLVRALMGAMRLLLEPHTKAGILHGWTCTQTTHGVDTPARPMNAEETRDHRVQLAAPIVEHTRAICGCYVGLRRFAGEIHNCADSLYPAGTILRAIGQADTSAIGVVLPLAFSVLQRLNWAHSMGQEPWNLSVVPEAYETVCAQVVDGSIDDNYLLSEWPQEWRGYERELDDLILLLRAEQSRVVDAYTGKVTAPKALPGVVSVNMPKTRRGFQRLAETTTRDQPIIAALREGKSYREVARECKVGKTTVERVAKAYGLTGHSPDPVPLCGTLQENLSIRGTPRNRGSS
jgi:hypothetical protein